MRFTLRESSNISHVGVRYRTDRSIKIVYKQTVNNGRPSMRAVIRLQLTLSEPQANRFTLNIRSARREDI